MIQSRMQREFKWKRMHIAERHGYHPFGSHIPDYDVNFWNTIYMQGRNESADMASEALIEVITHLFSDDFPHECGNCQKRNTCDRLQKCVWRPDYSLMLKLFSEYLTKGGWREDVQIADFREMNFKNMLDSDKMLDKSSE